MVNYKLSIITPDGQAFQGQVQSLQAPGQAGWLGILAQHAPMVVALNPGRLKIQQDVQEKSFEIKSGILEVDASHNVVILVDQADPA